MIWRPAIFWPRLNTQGSCPETLSKQAIHIDFDLLGAKYRSSTFVAEMVKGRVLSHARLVLTQNNIALGNLQFIYGVQCPEQHDLISKRRSWYPKRLHGHSLQMTASNEDNYHHGLFDRLPRLKVHHSSRFGKEAIGHVLLDRNSGQFQLNNQD